MVRLVALCFGVISLLFAWPVAAQEAPGFWDFEALLVRHADDVIEVPSETGPPLRRLTLPGGIVFRELRAQESTRIVGIDESGAGAVGCVMNLLVSVSATVAKCPQFATVAEENRLDANIVQVASFMAENLKPPRAQHEVLEFYREEMIKQRMQDLSLDRCEIGPDSQWFVDWVLAEEFGFELDKVLATPRLPVHSPCL